MKSYSHGLHDVHMASLFGGRIEGMEGRRKGREKDRKKKGERESWELLLARGEAGFPLKGVLM